MYITRTSQQGCCACFQTFYFTSAHDFTRFLHKFAQKPNYDHPISPMKLLLRLLAVMLLLPAATLRADNLRQISSREGISNNAVLSMAQDRHGFIWVATCDGLNMWDGARMRLYPDDWGGGTALSGNLIEEIAVTADSLFWLRTNYGLDLFDPATRRVEPHARFQGMYRIVTRRSDEVIVLTQDGSYSCYNPRTCEFGPAHPMTEIAYADLLALRIDPEDRLWLFTRKGVFHTALDLKAASGEGPVLGPLERFALPSNPLYAFTEQSRIHFIDERGVFYTFDTTDRRITYNKEMSGELARMGSVSSIVSDGDDFLVSFYTNGVVRLRTTPEQSVRYVTEHVNIPCGAFSLLRDARQDIVWIGTDGQGLYQHTRNATTFRSITFHELPCNLSKPVRALHVDREGALWIATKGEGILRIADFYDRSPITAARTGQFTAANSRLLDNSVYAFAPSRRDLLWIGSDGAGLNYYSYRDRQIHTLQTPPELRYVHALYESAPDTLWVATVGCGVFRLTLSGPPAQPILHDIEQLHFNDELEVKNFFFTLYPEDDRTLWFGNRGGGAVRYDIPSGRSDVQRFDLDRNATTNDIFAIHRSRNGTRYFGTSGGLIQCRKDSISRIPDIRNTVHAILEGRGGDLWLSTNRGLVQYSPRTGNAVTYGYSYGLNTIEYSDGAFFADPATGRLFFGGIDGLVMLEETDYREAEYNPPVLFRDIRLSDGIRNIDDLRNADGVLTIAPGQRPLGISISALDYVNGSNYTYYSRLAGYNDQWSICSPYISLADLPAGSYRLDVRYRNNITDTESPVYSLPIRIRPVWWASPAAKTGYTLLALLLVGCSIRYFLLRYRRRQDERRQRLETRRKEEVYESKIRFFQNITQEFSMPLTMISGPSQQILTYRQADPAILSYAQTIRRNVTKLLDLVSMLHEFGGSRMNRNETNETVELTPVAETARNILETYDEYSERNAIRRQVEIERNLVWPTDREGLSTILHTLLSSAFRHTPHGGEVSISIRNDRGMLHIAISNDSEGVDPADIEAIFDRYRVLDYFERKSEQGLSFQGDLRLAICHSIVERMQGRITVESTPNAQTTFTVRLPQLKVTEEQPAPSGNIIPIDRSNGLPLPVPARREFTFEKNRPTMFIVNDRSEVMGFVGELFAADYNIKMPAGMDEMIELLKQTHPDIVICDALSEQSDCLSLIKFIKESKLTSHIPVILLSTAQQIDERIKGVESGADICLALPFNVEYLKAVTEQLLKRNRSLKDYYKSSISAFELSDGRMLHQDDKEFIDRMLQIINDNITNTEISTKFIADALGISVRNLYRRLSGILNQTPTTIIKEYRLSKAEQLLTTTKLSIDEIIYKAGFVNRGTFFKCFAAKYGCTPKVYRKEKLAQVQGQTEADDKSEEHPET